MRQYKKHFIAFLFILLFASCTAPSTQSAQTLEVSPTVTSIAKPASAPCSSFSAAPTPGPDAPSLFPPVTEADHTRGPENAIITIMVYGDLQDATSGSFAGVVNRLLAEHPTEVQFISRIFPLVGRNDKAVFAAQVVEAAHIQNKYWEMHDLLFSQRANWVNMSVEDFEQWSAAQASALGMDVAQYQADVKSEAVVNLVQSNL